MKVFWSWQSDTPGKVGRHFVRDALNTAIERLKETPEIEEPPAREVRSAITSTKTERAFLAVPTSRA
jgi:hypothetical protein